MSVDPETDTPALLKEYSRRFHARPGWIFLTGKKENVVWAFLQTRPVCRNQGLTGTTMKAGRDVKAVVNRLIEMTMENVSREAVPSKLAVAS